MPRKTAARKSAAKPDPLAGLRVEVCASLGESYIKAECLLGNAADVLARLHQALEDAGRLRPSILPVADAPSGSVWVPEEGDPEQGRRRRFGFTAK